MVLKIRNLEDPKVFIELSKNIKYVYRNVCRNLQKYNVLTVFDDMITDIISNKDLNQVAAKLFMRGRKLNISTVFMIANLFHNSKRC